MLPATMLPTSLRAEIFIKRHADSFIKLGIGHRNISLGSNFKGKKSYLYIYLTISLMHALQLSKEGNSWSTYRKEGAMVSKWEIYQVHNL